MTPARCTSPLPGRVTPRANQASNPDPAAAATIVGRARSSRPGSRRSRAAKANKPTDEVSAPTTDAASWTSLMPDWPGAWPGSGWLDIRSRRNSPAMTIATPDAPISAGPRPADPLADPLPPQSLLQGGGEPHRGRAEREEPHGHDRGVVGVGGRETADVLVGHRVPGLADRAQRPGGGEGGGSDQSAQRQRPMRPPVHAAIVAATDRGRIRRWARSAGCSCACSPVSPPSGGSARWSTPAWNTSPTMGPCWWSPTTGEGSWIRRSWRPRCPGSPGSSRWPPCGRPPPGRSCGSRARSPSTARPTAAPGATSTRSRPATTCWQRAA